MYACSNCNGGLQYDIASGMLSCEYCDAKYDPYEMDGLQTAVENDSLEVTVFTCSQCGGELYATDTTVAGFCSFCGSTTVLKSRIEKTLRPDYIIPFQKTKEDCKDAYAKMMRFAIFAPKELKNKECIDSFRGIYMPYWMYDVEYADNISIQGSKVRMVDEYKIESFYNMTGDLKASYKGVPFDGSSSFSDDVSEKVAPFDVKSMKDFTPAFLSGFYGDTADVVSDVYHKDAMESMDKITERYIRKHEKFKGYEITDKKAVKNVLHPEVKDVHRAMLPVWFMSYRNNDRIAYATVNGQTGKVVVDLPVDIRKYLFGTLLLAIPIFVLMNMFFTLTPSVLLVLVSLFSVGISFLHMVEMKEIMERDNYQDDKGMRYIMEDDVETENGDDKSSDEEEQSKKRKKVPIVKCIIIGVLFFYFVLPYVLAFVKSMQLDWLLFLPVAATMVSTVIAVVKSISFIKKTELKHKVPANLCCFAATIIALVIILLKPIHDWCYYLGTIFSIAAVMVTLFDLIQKYNVLSTRKLPQFDYTGGDDNA